MTLHDQIGRKLEIPKLAPSRIVSTVPSQTELLYDFGLRAQLIGQTKFCIYPKDKAEQVQIIGGTKNLNVAKIKALEPDLIIANKEENLKEHIQDLMHDHMVYVSQVSSLQDALDMIEDLGKLTHKAAEALQIKEKILRQKTQLAAGIGAHPKKIRTAYLIWQNPYMTVGGDSFIHHMMEQAVFKNVFEDQDRYPSIVLDQLKPLRTELIMLSSEPFPFGEKHRSEIEKNTGIRTILVDGALFSWYGSRLIHSFQYFEALRHQI